MLLACGWLGNLASIALSLPIPGSVVGMLLLLLFLVVYGGVPKGLAKISAQLLYLLPLLFLPAAVGIFFFRGLALSDWLALLTAIIAGTLISIAICALLLKKMLQRTGTDKHE
ncbi:CidA/LrgA family protein [Microbulbifer sp. OS29]|uniref:CidA/LrgA family protein n=1 Tax=Microbulbifer okhotskensis TaxID=2926617 RepID=A0A9X2J5Y1_9GAMM|nr:CidA/LrgA family protein [Microbulbifer okhotskensis]MCO1332881.1 CidA/LrgA family protein [Microbulbifer okhotskensis]